VKKRMNSLDKYLSIVDVLRESRRSPDWRADHDRPVLAFLEDLYTMLSETEQGRAEVEGWRAWPEQYLLP
jgi:hypothetical protein